MRQVAFYILTSVLFLVSGSSGIAQDLPVSVKDFDAASIEVKRKVLTGIAIYSVELPVADAIALLKAGLLDADRDVRRVGLSAVAMRASGTQWTAHQPEARRERIREEWANERPLLVELRPHVLAALNDPDPDIRDDAVFALERMDFKIGDRELILSEQTVADFAARYAPETVGRVRGKIVQGFAVSPVDFPKLREVLLDALEDPHAWVRYQAFVGAKRLELAAALPKAISALAGDPDAQVRRSAADAMGAYCATFDCLNALEQALATETDELARYAIENAVTKVRKKPTGPRIPA